MNKVYYVMLFALFYTSCDQSSIGNQVVNKNDKSESLLGEIIQAAIQQDSLDLTIPIAEQLTPIGYFPYYKDEDSTGNLLPPPPPKVAKGESSNEVMIAERFYYDSNITLSQLDKAHIKQQLVKAKQWNIPTEYIEGAIFFSVEQYKSANKIRTPSYRFYTPIFSNDSSLVYLQYDRYCGGCSNGTGVIITKQNNAWKVIGRIPRWHE